MVPFNYLTPDKKEWSNSLKEGKGTLLPLRQLELDLLSLHSQDVSFIFLMKLTLQGGLKTSPGGLLLGSPCTC